MHISSLVPVLASFAAAASAASAPGFISTAVAPAGCANKKVAHTAFIGKDKNVEVEFAHCGSAPIVSADGHVVPTVPSLEKRQSTNSTNVCGAPCNTFCFAGPTGGPNGGDCTVIADALLFDSENGKVFFNATAQGTPTDQVTLRFRSCLTYFLDQGPNNLTYCNSAWSSLVNFLSTDCNAAHNAHGGLCVANDQQWYVQVQNSSG